MSEKRFARQHFCEPPPGFPLASPFTAKVHHLSGLSNKTLVQYLVRSCRSPPKFQFHPAFSRSSFISKQLSLVTTIPSKIAGRIPKTGLVYPFSFTPPSFHSSRFLFVLKDSLPFRLALFDNSLARVSRRVRISRFLLPGLFRPDQIFLQNQPSLRPISFLQVFLFRNQPRSDL